MPRSTDRKSFDPRPYNCTSGSERIQPGSVSGSTEINCPHCGELLTAGVNEPFGEESYQCSGVFEVAWGEGQVRYDAY